MHFAIVFSDARQMEIELRFAKEESAAAERAAVLHQQQYKKLLGQILPEQIAQELLRTGSCKPKKHASVSVLFADLVGFSEIASKWPPEKLIQELDECFWAFDQIMARHGLEKLKTIGDGYMAASGLMTPDDKHAEHAVLAAMEMSEYIGTKKRFWEETYNEPYWDVRIGINSGPVMAGIIGKRKFSYDIWGDTVNVASRMEQNSPVGKVSVSEASRSLLSDMFVCSQREAIHVKGKGLMRPFIIVGCKLKKNTPSAGSARAE